MEIHEYSGVLKTVRDMMSSEFRTEVENRKLDFIKAGKSSPEFIYGELCFCILTANTSAEMGIKTQEAIGIQGFLEFDEDTMRKKLKEVRYRFYNVRSKFLVQSRWIVDELPGILAMKDRIEARDYLVENLKGIGYKEASHFLRNVGIFDFSILDKHILRMIKKEYPDGKFRVGSRKNYLETEKTILEFAESVSLDPGILDLYLWKIATGKLLK
ncbi:N-glycosylase/DNA lyase [Oxyplasma meridianum]|uniref:8-oxoguanine DNA glycosylase/AP lyase n=1 Tax=Oxyplasma meridianum TaxID=3073602 RepID=A0AAX4NHY7_9ARCH